MNNKQLLFVLILSVFIIIFPIFYTDFFTNHIYAYDTTHGIYLEYDYVNIYLTGLIIASAISWIVFFRINKS